MRRFVMVLGAVLVGMLAAGALTTAIAGTGIEYDDPEALAREYPYYDPITTLPEEGKRFWREFQADRRRKEMQPA